MMNDKSTPKGFGRAMTGASMSGKDERREWDFYPTAQEDVTRALFAHQGFLDMLPGGSIREPACGEGHMSKVIESYGRYVVSSDIVDRGYGEFVGDFLDDVETHGCRTLITNPPFTIKHGGKSVNGQTLFLRKAAELGFDVVAMLTKVQFWNGGKRSGRIDLWADHQPTWVLPLTWRPDFTGKGAPVMDCQWVVWDLVNGAEQTLFEPLPKPILTIEDIEDL